MASNTYFSIQPITVEDKNSRGYRDYYGLSDFSKTSSVELYLQKEGDLHQIDLERKILENIAAYLRKRPVNGDFDCSSFVHYIHGISYEQPFFSEDMWDISKIEERDMEKLGLGDVVGISRTPDGSDMTHVAAYLSNQLFISQFGNMGPLIVASMQEMRKAFKGDYLFCARPHNPHISSYIDQYRK